MFHGIGLLFSDGRLPRSSVFSTSRSTCVMAASGCTPDDARSGISFGAELQVPWNAPEAFVKLD